MSPSPRAPAELAQGARKKVVERTRSGRSGGLPDSAVWILALGLLVALVVATVMFLAPGDLGSLAPGGDDESPAADAGADRDDESGADGPWDPYATSTDGGRADTEQARGDWEPVVERFTARFLDPRSRQWLADLRPLVTAQLFARLRQVDPANVPAGRFVAADVVDSGDTAADVDVEVRSPGGAWVLGVRVVDLPDDGVGWRVYGYENRTAEEGDA